MAELKDIYNFLPLTETILTSGQPTEEQFATVAAAGVGTVVNLALSSSTNALADEEAIVRNQGMDYIHIPVIWEKPDLVELEKFMDSMDRLKGRKTLVHCAANMRVSAFVALYRILRLGWTRDKAFRDLNRIWNPDETQVWKKFIDTALKASKK